MKTFFLLLAVLLIPLFLFSQDFSNSSTGDSVTLCIIRTDEGTRLRGKLISENSEQLILIDLTFGEITLRKKNVRYFEKMKPESIFEIEYGSNNSITGKIVSADKSRWKVNSKTLGEVEIKSSEIKDFYMVKGSSDIKDLQSGTGENSGEKKNIDPGRYFAGPAPFALKRNTLIYQNTEILLNGFSYGLFKDFTITGGALYFYIPYANLKYATELTDNVHLSVGAMGFGFPIFSSGDIAPLTGAAYAQAAFGTSENNFSLGAYYPYIGSFLMNGNGFSDEFGFSLGGIKRINKRVSIMAEDYFIPYKQAVYHYNTYPYYTTYTTDYINAGAAGVKIFLGSGLFHSNSAVLNIGMLWIVNSDIGSSSYVAFPVISYACPFR